MICWVKPVLKSSEAQSRCNTGWKNMDQGRISVIYLRNTYIYIFLLWSRYQISTLQISNHLIFLTAPYIIGSIIMFYGEGNSGLKACCRSRRNRRIYTCILFLQTTTISESLSLSVQRSRVAERVILYWASKIYNQRCLSSYYRLGVFITTQSGTKKF